MKSAKSTLTANELLALIKQGEGQGVEFKTENVKPADLAQSLVAMANTGGGTALIGVADDGTVSGVRDLKEVNDRILIAGGRECCDPELQLEAVDTVELEKGRRVVAVRVPRCQGTVHSANGRYLVRRGSRDVAMTGAQLRELLLGGRDLTPKQAPGLLLPQGPSQLFEILDYDATLELKDRAGREALLQRRQTVRFLQDGVVAFYDHAWGDGRILVGYRVRPGVVADRYRVGQRYTTVISLRETRNAGDVLTFQFRRRIVDGFLQDEEWFETEVEHRTRRLGMSVVFPKGRPPRRAWLVERRRDRVLPLSEDAIRRSLNGVRIAWRTEKPRMGESYLLKWRW